MYTLITILLAVYYALNHESAKYTLDLWQVSHLNHCGRNSSFLQLDSQKGPTFHQRNVPPVSCVQRDRRLTGAGRWAEVIQQTATQGQGDIQTHLSLSRLITDRSSCLWPGYRNTVSVRWQRSLIPNCVQNWKSTSLKWSQEDSTWSYEHLRGNYSVQ